MMTQFRKLSRFVLFIVIFAFAALIFFEWGMNATVSIKRRDLDKGIIARINDIPVSYTEYRRLMNEAYTQREQYRGMGEDEIKAKVWQAIVEEKLWRDIIAREEVSVTDEEVWTIIRSQPPRELLDTPELKDSTGAFDFKKYQMLLQNPQNFSWLLKYEMEIRNMLPREKVRMELMTTGWISPQEESLRFDMLTRIMSATFLYLPYDRIRDQIEVSDQILADYYQDHLADFASVEQRSFKFAHFSKEATSEDTANAQIQIDEIASLVKEGREFTEIAQDYADNSDLSVKIKTEQDVPIELLGVFKKLKDNQVSEPIRTPRGYTILKRTNRSEFLKIEVRIEVSPSTIAAIKDRIDAFIQTAQDLSFDEAARNNNLTVRSTGPLAKDQRYLPGLDNPGQLLDFGFKAKPGAVGAVQTGAGGYFVFVLDSIIPKQIPDFEAIKERVYAEYRRRQEPVRAAVYIEASLAKIPSLEALAQSDTRFMIETIRAADYAKLKTDYPPELVGALCSLVPQQTKHIVTDWGAYIIRCDALDRMPFDSTKVAAIYQDQETKVRTVYQYLFGDPKIVDHRDAFFE